MNPATVASQQRPVIYPESDGEPMAENTEQYHAIVKVKENLELVFRDDQLVLIAADLFWYPKKGNNKNVIVDDRSVKREVGQLEKTIAKLDAQKKTLNDQLMQSTEAIAAMKLHEELTKVTTELETAEMRWAELQEQMEAE